MALAETAEKNSLATKYSTDGVYAALFTGSGPSGATGAATNEVTGGSYARVAITWGTAANGVISGTATLNVPAGVTVAYWGVCTTGVAGTGDVRDYGALGAAQAFATAGTYALTLTFTVS